MPDSGLEKEPRIWPKSVETKRHALSRSRRIWHFSGQFLGSVLGPWFSEKKSKHARVANSTTLVTHLIKHDRIGATSLAEV